MNKKSKFEHDELLAIVSIIDRMVRDYPNDMDLGDKIRQYVRWLDEKPKNVREPNE